MERSNSAKGASDLEQELAGRRGRVEVLLVEIQINTHGL
jgi:hypothetical protein